MNTAYTVVIYFLIFLIFLIVVGRGIIVRSRIKREEFTSVYPKLLSAIKQNKLNDAIKIFEQIKWNSNYTFYNQVELFKLIEMSIHKNPGVKTEKEYNLLIQKLEEISKEKGWTDFKLPAGSED